MKSLSVKVKELKTSQDILDDSRRPGAGTSGISGIVESILSDIRNDGDAALIKLIRKYDKYDADIENIKVTKDEIESAVKTAERDYPDLVKALSVSRKNIEDFHKAQYKRDSLSWMTENTDGKKMGQKVTPLGRVGLYIPGGRYAYPSTLLMTAIPAVTAGVGEIAVCSPPRNNGSLDPVMLYLCHMLGIKEIYKMGGAQAVGALAYGTCTVKKVDKIAGPGNIYVTEAKRLVFGVVGIDSLAGPSDITVMADSSSRPDLIAIDMLSQAEHDPFSRSILLSADRDVAVKTARNIGKMLDSFRDRQEYAGNLNIMLESVRDFCRIYYSTEIDTLIEAVNIIAPEHLEIMLKDTGYVLDRIKNAGAIFIGDHTPVAVGDYIGGTNHVIPTNGNARFSSPLGVYDFLKKSSICSYSRSALEAEKDHIINMAGFEGLYVHRDSVKKRFEKEY